MFLITLLGSSWLQWIISAFSSSSYFLASALVMIILFLKQPNSSGSNSLKMKNHKYQEKWSHLFFLKIFISTIMKEISQAVIHIQLQS